MSTILIFGITTILNNVFTSRLFSASTFFTVLPTAVFGVLKIVDVFLRGKEISSIIKDRCISTAKKMLRNNIIRTKDQNERKYMEEIIDCCEEQFFKKYK